MPPPHPVASSASIDASGCSRSSSSASSSGLDNIRTLVEALGPPRARLRACSSPAPTARDRSRRWSSARCARPAAAPDATPRRIWSTSPNASPSTASRSTPRRSRRARRDVLDVEAACRADGRLRAHADVLRGDDGDRVRAVSPGGRRRGGAGGGARRPLRRHQRRDADGHGDRVDRPRSHAQLGRHARGDRREKAGIARAGRAAGRRRDGGRGATRSSKRVCAERARRSSTRRRRRVRRSPACSTDARTVTHRDRDAQLRPGEARARGRASGRQRHVAVRLLEELDAQGLPSTAAIETGLARRALARPARRVALAAGGDAAARRGAQRRRGARAGRLSARRTGRTAPPLVFGALADKDAGGMIAALAPVVGDIIVTHLRSAARGRRSSALAAAARAHRAGAPPVRVQSRHPRRALAPRWRAGAARVSSPARSSCSASSARDRSMARRGRAIMRRGILPMAMLDACMLPAHAAARPCATLGCAAIAALGCCSPLARALRRAPAEAQALRRTQRSRSQARRSSSARREPLALLGQRRRSSSRSRTSASPPTRSTTSPTPASPARARATWCSSTRTAASRPTAPTSTRRRAPAPSSTPSARPR